LKIDEDKENYNNEIPEYKSYIINQNLLSAKNSNSNKNKPTKNRFDIESESDDEDSTIMKQNN